MEASSRVCPLHRQRGLGKGETRQNLHPAFSQSCAGRLPFLPAQCQPQHWLVPAVLFPKGNSLLFSTRRSGTEVPLCTDWVPHSPGSLTESWQATGPCRGKGQAEALARRHTGSCHHCPSSSCCQQEVLKEAIYSRGCPDRQLPGLQVKSHFLWLRNWVPVQAEASWPSDQVQRSGSIIRGCSQS